MSDATDQASSAPTNMWLHLDVQTACAGDMLCAALLSLGLKPGIVRDGLARVGLHPAVGPKLTTTKRNGISALHLSFVDRHGAPLEGGPIDPPSSYVGQPDRHARRARRPKLRVRTQEVAAEAGIEQQTDVADAAIFSLHQEDAPPALDDVHPAPDDVMRWMAGEQATGAELEARLSQGRLTPIAAALSRKALRRLLTALGSVQGVSRQEAVVEGNAAVDILCDVVGFASLIEALNPERVTASVVGVTTAQVRGGGGPEPWVVEVLKDVPTRERDQDKPACTPTGAALVWAVTHHFGARLGSIVRGVGVGAGTRDIRGVSNVTRAFIGDIAVPHTGATSTFSAALGQVQSREAFLHALVKAGAKDLFFVAGTTLDGALSERVMGTCAEEDLEQVRQVLLVEGAAGAVQTAPADVQSGNTETTTVRIGSAQKGEAVDVDVLLIDGRPAKVTVNAKSALSAAQRLGWEVEAVHSAARLAFERQSRQDADPVPPETV